MSIRTVRFCLLFSFSVISAFCIAIPGSFAEGLLIEQQKGEGLSLVSSRLQVKIEAQVATTVVEQVYKGVSDGKKLFYLFSLPPAASVVQFELWKDKAWKEAEIRGQAQPDMPGSAEGKYDKYLGKNPFRIQLEGKGDTLRLKLTYMELLKYEKGKVSYTYPTPRFDGGHSIPVELELVLSLQRKIASASFLHHKGLSFSKKSEKMWAVTSTLQSAQQEKPLQLVYQPIQDGLSLRFFAHRDAKWSSGSDEQSKMFRDGYFLLMIEPKEDISREKIIAKTFTLIVDTSQSMSGQKLEEARKAALRCIEGLHPQDHFNIIDFASDVVKFRSAPVPMTQQNRQSAKAFISKLRVRGATNIHDALQEAIASNPGERPHLILFLTDGHPTVGESNPREIVQMVQRDNRHHARIFAFGIGGNYNHSLLEQLAHSTKGRAFRLTESNMSKILGDFFQSINSPVLTDLTISFGKDTVTNRVVPNLTHLPNAYLGSQLLVLGRYHGFGKRTIEVKGKVGDQQVRYTLNVNLQPASAKNAFLPRIWARQYAQELWRAFQREPAKSELKDKVKQIGLLYRVQTPVTSFGFQDPNNNTQANVPGSHSPQVGPHGSPVAACGCSVEQRSESSGLLWMGMMCLLGLFLIRRKRG